MFVSSKNIRINCEGIILMFNLTVGTNIGWIKYTLVYFIHPIKKGKGLGGRTKFQN